MVPCGALDRRGGLIAHIDVLREILLEVFVHHRGTFFREVVVWKNVAVWDVVVWDVVMWDVVMWDVVMWDVVMWWEVVCCGCGTVLGSVFGRHQIGQTINVDVRSGTWWVQSWRNMGGSPIFCRGGIFWRKE